MKNPTLTLMLAMSFMPLEAIADRPEHEPHSTCNQGAVNSCVEANRASGDQARLSGHSLDPEISALSQSITELGSNRDAHKVKISALIAEISALSTEITFIEKQNSPPTAPILPGFPGEEDFFSLHPLERSWLERYPSERAQRLSVRVREDRSEEGEINIRLQKILTEFTRLYDQYQSLSGQRAGLLTEANQHARMCQGGCHDQFCPPREP